MKQRTKSNINDLKNVRYYTNLPDISDGQIYAITNILIKEKYIYVPNNRPKLRYLLQFLLNGDCFINGISIFKETYYRYLKEKEQSNKIEISNTIEENLEENMDYISKQLLEKDEIYY